MSRPKIPGPVKLIIGIFTKEKGVLKPISSRLTEQFGRLDMVSRWLPFDKTDYYQNEMGSPLFRRMLSFRTLIPRDELVTIKQMTNDLEREYTEGEKRSANIDPGYVSREHVVLATGKNYSHRIYLGAGIYADLTLIYSKGAFKTLPWTYRDYAGKPLIEFLERVRTKYVHDLALV
ncbi:MAG: DUF4416 family protein [Thermodesulfobacteriota bacterium]